MTEREFIEGIAVLCSSVGKDMTADQMKSWRVMFDDLTGEQFRAGIIATIRSYKFAGFPPIGVIRENCGVIGGTITAKDRPTLAWEAVRRAINRVGGYDSPDFDDRHINAAIRAIGGWVALCDSTSEELVWREKDFLRNYSALVQLTLEEEQTARLAGIIEKTNGTALPAPLVNVGCLTVGTNGITRRIEIVESKRIGPTPAARLLANKLDSERPEAVKRIPLKSKTEQLAALLGR